MNTGSSLLLGSRYGRLFVFGVDRDVRGRLIAVCLCDCGEIKVTRADACKRGKTNSCGCLHRESAAKTSVLHRKTHGKSKSPEYYRWKAMIRRCHDDRDASFERYGSRGISVCDRWRTSFEAFLADVGSRPDGMSLDRIDNDGNYEPGNVKWSTPTEQANNRRARRWKVKPQ